MKHRVTFTVEVDSGDRLLSVEDAATIARGHMQQPSYSYQIESRHDVNGPYASKPAGHEGDWDPYPEAFQATATWTRVESEVARELELVSSAPLDLASEVRLPQTDHAE